MQVIKSVNLIVACQMDGYGIGYQNKIPWRSSADLSFLKRVTSTTDNPKLQNAVIMGRRTFTSIGKFLPKRINYVITRDQNLHDNVHFFPSLHSALQAGFMDGQVEKMFILGGAEIYHQALTEHLYMLDKAYVTLMESNYQCDRFFDYNIIKERFKFNSSLACPNPNEPNCYIEEYTRYRINSGEEEYLQLVSKILDYGESPRPDRTGVGTRSLFGERMEFDISESIPLLTTKKIPWKMVLRELLWFVSGSTDNTVLQKKNVHIWDGNTTRGFLDARGLIDLPVGDIGAGYGHQWRHFGAEYKDCKTDYTGQGVDQLAEVINLIRTDPTSRRIILTGWNPAALSRMALPPCHSIVVQFYVTKDGSLDCQMYQRSADVALGVPFNIASYAMLVYMIAHVTELKPRRFIHILGDAHIYQNHVEAIKTQLDRMPYDFPKFVIKRQVQNIDDFIEDDFDVIGYLSHPTIKMQMAV